VFTGTTQQPDLVFYLGWKVFHCHCRSDIISLTLRILAFDQQQKLTVIADSVTDICKRCATTSLKPSHADAIVPTPAIQQKLLQSKTR
jgi:hypothetical protein